MQGLGVFARTLLVQSLYIPGSVPTFPVTYSYPFCTFKLGVGVNAPLDIASFIHEQGLSPVDSRAYRSLTMGILTISNHSSGEHLHRRARYHRRELSPAALPAAKPSHTVQRVATAVQNVG
jgi:hypothetical protein